RSPQGARAARRGPAGGRPREGAGRPRAGRARRPRRRPARQSSRSGRAGSRAAGPARAAEARRCGGRERGARADRRRPVRGADGMAGRAAAADRPARGKRDARAGRQSRHRERAAAVAGAGRVTGAFRRPGVRLAVLGVAAYLVFLLVNAPAAWVGFALERESRGALALGDPAGTLWKGRGLLALRSGGAFRGIADLEWGCKPLAVLTGRRGRALSGGAPET